jgi:hypothetical protein
MPDQIGNINVPTSAPAGVWPLIVEYGAIRLEQPRVQVHQFESANDKIEQRYLMGSGVQTFQLAYPFVSPSDIAVVREFWEAHEGAAIPFTLNFPAPDGESTTAYTVRFAAEPLTFGMDENGAARLEVILRGGPAAAPVYTSAATLKRFPSSGLNAALLGQVQALIPLVTITARKSGYPVLYLSDRRLTLDGQLFQARLLEWGPISQSIDFANDQASFVFGNADRVMSDLAEDVDLRDAVLQFSLLHVGTLNRIDIWRGLVNDFDIADTAAQFVLNASDSAGVMNATFPPRNVDPSCWKVFADGVNCTYAGPETVCDKSWVRCQMLGNTGQFGGIVIQPQSVNIKDNGTGSFGLNRRLYSPTSLINDSAAGQPLQHIYTDEAMPVSCTVVAGREESDFYAALGIVGEGPIGSYQAPNYATNPKVLPYKLDGQPHHGAEKNNAFGLRRSYGHDPVQANDPDAGSEWFSLGSGTPETFAEYKAAGVAFVFIRRSDPKGSQLSGVQDRTMQAGVSGGRRGWGWTDAATRVELVPNTNPIWIAVNSWLRVNGVQDASAVVQVNYFDVGSAIAAAAICDTVVPGIFGGTEKQFRYRGVIRDQKDFKSVLAEILANCLGYAYMCNGRLKFGIRSNASAVEAFGPGNVILGSARLRRRGRDQLVNTLTVQFNDSEQEYKSVTLTSEDEHHRKLYGSKKSGSLSLNGTAWKSQAARIAETRKRELVGGINEAEYKKVRAGSIRTTFLALSVEPGMVIGYDGRNFRVRQVTWNSDFSVQLDVESVVASMYDMTVGPKPPDVEYQAPPADQVTQLQPSDVVPIGSDAFQVTAGIVADGNGVKRYVMDVVYDPPTPLGTFSGVSGWIETPSGVYSLGDHDYNGDGTGTAPGRYGECRFVAPAPAVSESWTLYLCSRSPAYRKSLRLSSEANPTPHFVLSVDSVDPIVTGTPAENVATVAATVTYNGDRWGLSVTVGFGASRANIARAVVIVRGPTNFGTSIDREAYSFVPPPTGGYTAPLGGEWLRGGSAHSFVVLVQTYNAQGAPTEDPVSSSVITVQPVNSSAQATSTSASAWYDTTADGVGVYGFSVAFTQANEIDTSHTEIWIEAFDSVTSQYRREQLYTQTGPGGGDNGFAITGRGGLVDATPTSSQNFRITFYTITKVGNRRSSPPQVIVSVSPQTGAIKLNRADAATLGPGLAVVSNQLRIPASGITNPMMGPLIVEATNLANASVTASKYAFQSIPQAAIGLLAVSNAQVNDLSATKLTAGTITASVSMTAPTITSTSGSGTVSLAAGVMTSEFGLVRATLGSGFVLAQNLSSGVFASLSDNGLIVNRGSINRLVANFNGSDVVLAVRNSFGNLACELSSSNFDLFGIPLRMNSSVLVNAVGQFVGSGVNVGVNGVNAGGYNINGGFFGQTLTSLQIITDIRNNFGTIERKSRWIDIRGGVVTSISAESGWIAI